MTEPTYEISDLAAAEAELAAESEDPGPDVPDTEADETVLEPDGDEDEDEVVTPADPSDDAPAGGDA